MLKPKHFWTYLNFKIMLIPVYFNYWDDYLSARASCTLYSINTDYKRENGPVNQMYQFLLVRVMWDKYESGCYCVMDIQGYWRYRDVCIVQIYIGFLSSPSWK